jgi:predicted enzyme related to lactoylglutathione lyase
MPEVEKIFVLPDCGTVQSDQTGSPDILPGNESPVYSVSAFPPGIDQLGYHLGYIADLSNISKFLFPLHQKRVRECLMPAIVHFDVPTDDVERAKKFYSTLFGWQFQSFPEMQYNLFTTTNLDGTPGVGGGMGKRMDSSQRIMNYFGVPSIDAAMNQVKSLGGKVLSEKMVVPGMGFLATCMDTEGNLFGLWEETTQAR